MDAAVRTDLVAHVGELKKVADSFIAKLKKTSGEVKKQTVAKKLERIDISKMKATSGKIAKSAVTTKPKSIEKGGKKTKK